MTHFYCTTEIFVYIRLLWLMLIGEAVLWEGLSLSAQGEQLLCIESRAQTLVI